MSEDYAPILVEPAASWEDERTVYYATHVTCPVCRSDHIAHDKSMVWGACEPPFVDGSTTICERCGWQGVTDDLKTAVAKWKIEGF